MSGMPMISASISRAGLLVCVYTFAVLLSQPLLLLLDDGREVRAKTVAELLITAQTISYSS